MASSEQRCDWNWTDGAARGSVGGGQQRQNERVKARPYDAATGRAKYFGGLEQERAGGNTAGLSESVTVHGPRYERDTAKTRNGRLSRLWQRPRTGFSHGQRAPQLGRQ